MSTISDYNAVRGFWPVEELELAERLAGCGNVVRGGCLLATSA